MKRTGFTLIETLVGLALSLFVITAGLEFFVFAEKAFLRLKSREEAGQAALAALDRIRIDLLHSGLGLAAETALALVEPVEVADGELRTTSLDRPLVLAADARPGEARLALVSSTGITSGQRVVLRQGGSGEVRTVAGVEPGAVVLDAPLGSGYAAGAAVLSLLARVTYFRDGATRILRRRVNASPAQPLLEDTAAVEWSVGGPPPLVRIRIEPGTEGAHPHEATVFLKNPALAGNFGT